MQNPAMHIRVQFICVAVHCQFSWAHMWDWSYGPYRNSMFHIERNHQTGLQGGCPVLHSHKQAMMDPASCIPHQHLLGTSLLILALVLHPQWLGSDFSSWVWFPFPWWLMMLKILSCVYWPSVHLLYRNIYSNLLIFYLAHLSLLLSCKFSVIFWIVDCINKLSVSM